MSASDWRKLWILGHPFARRQWLQFQVLDPETGKWTSGWVFTEWAEGAERNGVAVLPAEPPGNVDPLVVGRWFYWDYCKRKQNGRTNEFQPGDMILFASYRERLGGLIVDTVFVVGEAKPWPGDTRSIPAWPDLDICARRVHFHDEAHRVQHREVHEPVRGTPVRSYRARAFEEDETLYSWVPFSLGRREEPFAVRSGSRAHSLLSGVYPGDLRDQIQGQFAIIDVPATLVSKLHVALREEAGEQGLGIGAGVELIPGGEVAGGRSDLDCAGRPL